VTDEHFASAVKASNASKHPDERVSANLTRNPTQHMAETGCNDKKTPFHPNENRPVLPGDSSHCSSLQSTTMADTGLEQVQNIRRKTHNLPPPVTETVTVDRDLQNVIDVWANLPGHVKRTIAVLVNASKSGVTG